MRIDKRGFLVKNKRGVHLIRKEMDDCFWLYLYRRDDGWNALRRLTTTQVKQHQRRQMPDSQAEFYFRKAEELK